MDTTGIDEKHKHCIHKRTAQPQTPRVHTLWVFARKLKCRSFDHNFLPLFEFANLSARINPVSKIEILQQKSRKKFSDSL